MDLATRKTATAAAAAAFALSSMSALAAPAPAGSSGAAIAAEDTVHCYGVHSCMGAHLARLEIKICIQEFLRRIPNFQVKEGAEIE